MQRRIAACGALVVLGVALAACDPNPKDEIGVLRSPDGGVSFLFNPCRESYKLTSITVLVPTEEIPAGWTEESVTEELLWKIEATSPSDIRTVTYGRVPEGFSEVSRSSPLPLTGDVWVLFGTTYDDVNLTEWRPEEHDADFVWADRRNLSPEDWDERDTCTR